MEWEEAALNKVRTVLEEDALFLVCSEHKTWKNYGDLEEYIPVVLLIMLSFPNLEQSRPYMSLHKPELQP